MRRIASVVSLLVLLAVLAPASVVGADSAAYLDGLDALARGEFDAARRQFEAAVDADEDDPAPHLALAASLTFLERFDEAFAHADRADKLLLGKQKAPRLWKATIVAMQGKLSEDTKYFPAATRDPFETDLREMSHRYGDPIFRATTLREPRSDAEAVLRRERALFADLARRFVERIRPATPQLRPALAKRGIEKFLKGEFAAAYGDLLDAHRMDPADLNALFHLAGCRSELGFFEGARDGYTRCLTKETRWKEAYAGRSVAYAGLGDDGRARADLAIAKSLGFDVGGAEAAVAKRLRPPPVDVPATLRDLLRAPDRAADFARVHGARRKRADETYQDGLRMLRDSGDLAALGAFLYDNATTALVEWVEPRSDPTPVRPQESDSELTEAEKTLDAALGKNAADVRAKAYRAACRMRRFEWDKATQELEDALSLAPKDPLVLDLFSQVVDHAASVNAAAAADLRRVQSWSDYWYIYTRWPSKAELQQAGALDREAARLREKARAALAAAAEEAAGTTRGDLLRARIAEGEGNLEGARKACLAATKRDETSWPAWRKLAELEGRLGHVKEAYEAQFRAANLTHTTSAPMLKFAWIELARTAFKSVGDALDVAERGDPTDPRVAAYRGALAEAREKPEEAAGWYDVAFRLAEIRMASNGVVAGETGARLVPGDVALAMRLAFRVGRIHLGLGKPDVALASLSRVTTYLARTSVADRYLAVPSATLPGPMSETGLPPPAPNLETIAAWIELRTGDALARLSRAAEALPHFQWVSSFESRKPSIADVGMEIREPAALALAHVAKTLLALGRTEEARRARLSIPRRRDLTPSSQRELEAITAELDAALRGGR